MGRRLAPRNTWPEIRITLLPLPWTWRRPRIYHDDYGWLLLTEIAFGPLVIEWGGQDGGWLDQFTNLTCKRCRHVVDIHWARHSGGLCGDCFADAAVIPLTRFGTP